MKLLHLVHQYPPEHIGGIEIYTQALARRQVSEGHSVAVFYPTVGHESAAVQPALDSEVRVYRVPAGSSDLRSRSRTRVFATTFHSHRLSTAFAATLESERPDLVHIQHLMGLPASIVGQIHTRGIPYLITLLDYWFPCANAQLITNYDNTLCVGPDARWHNCGRCALARAGLNQLERLAPAVAPLMAYRHRLLYRVFRHASHILAPNEFVREIHASAGFPTERMVIVPFGTDGSAADLEAARLAATQRTASGLRIGYVGSVAWQKGVDYLVAAVNQLPHEGVTLSIYGDLSAFPNYVAKLRRLAQHPGIHFDGAVSRQALWPVLGALDVLAIPSVWYEGSPFIIREAFAAGVPVIASRIGALPEMVRDGVNGLLFPPGDAAALHDALRTLLDNPTQLARLRANVPSVLSFGEHVGMLMALYDKTIQTG